MFIKRKNYYINVSFPDVNVIITTCQRHCWDLEVDPPKKC